MKLAVRKITIDPFVDAVEQLAVHPLKVHRQSDGLAHSHVLEFLIAQIEDIALKVTRVAVFERAFDQFPGAELLAGVLACPVARNELAHEVVLAGLKALKARSFVKVDLEGDAVEVELALAAGQINAPIGGITHIGDVAAHGCAARLVRAGAYGQLRHNFVKWLAAAPGPAEHRHAAHHQRQLRVGHGKVKTHRTF